jgi:ribosome-associated protein
MIEVTPRIQIPESELSERFIRSPGPGGQNVNKLATAVQVRFDVAGSPSLPEDVRARLMRLAGRRLDGAGVLTIEAHRFRTRERNREDALERLIDLICRAAHRPKPRVATRPTRASKERRLESKRARSATKRLRGGPSRGEV